MLNLNKFYKMNVFLLPKKKKKVRDNMLTLTVVLEI